jgi:hypothetical protein
MIRNSAKVVCLSRIGSTAGLKRRMITLSCGTLRVKPQASMGACRRPTTCSNAVSLFLSCWPTPLTDFGVQHIKSKLGSSSRG